MSKDLSQLCGDTNRSSDTKGSRMRRVLNFLRIPIIILIAITLFECSIGNLPFWNSVTGSTDSESVHNTLGSGVKLSLIHI